MEVGYRDMGLIRYTDCWREQQTVFDRLVASKSFGPDKKTYGGNETPSGSPEPEMLKNPAPELPGQVVILCEHPHVYTLGRSGNEGNLLMNSDFLSKIGAEFHRIDRGGDITYHGPGQLVGYPIVDLERLGLGLKEYIHALEETIIATIAHYGIRGERSEGATGVWLPAGSGKGLRKIAAIGVRSSRFVTMHGFALNVSTRMEYFGYINPCGFTDRGVTSVEQELGTAPAMEEVKKIYKEQFERTFAVKLV